MEAAPPDAVNEEAAISVSSAFDLTLLNEYLREVGRGWG